MAELSGGIAVVSLLLVLAVLFRLGSLERRMARLSRIDAKLDSLLEHAGIEFHPYGDVAQEIVQALEQGNKIEAIKHYRSVTGVGLKEAKDYVEEVQRRAGLA